MRLSLYFLRRERIKNLIDEGTFEEFDQNLLSVDVLKFTGVASYSERLQTYREKTGLSDRRYRVWAARGP